MSDPKDGREMSDLKDGREMSDLKYTQYLINIGSDGSFLYEEFPYKEPELRDNPDDTLDSSTMISEPRDDRGRAVWNAAKHVKDKNPGKTLEFFIKIEN